MLHEEVHLKSSYLEIYEECLGRHAYIVVHTNPIFLFQTQTEAVIDRRKKLKGKVMAFF